MGRSSLLSRGTLFVASLPLFLLGCSGAPAGSSTESSTDGLSVSTGPSLECTGGLPDICEICPDGKSECAHWVVEHGKCEVQICAPVATTPPEPVCFGPLPDICERCDDGKTECAHWVVEHGKCEIQICPPTSVTPPPPPPPPVCTGPLPDICEVCADGQEECAHWAVIGGVCTVQICPDPPSTINPGGTATAG
jgi:hypothetical protein